MSRVLRLLLILGSHNKVERAARNTNIILYCTHGVQVVCSIENGAIYIVFDFEVMAQILLPDFYLIQLTQVRQGQRTGLTGVSSRAEATQHGVEIGRFDRDFHHNTQYRTVCVFFTLNRSSTRRHPAHPVSVLILHPRKISSVVTSYDTEIMHRNAFDNAMSCPSTGYDRHNIHTLATEIHWKREYEINKNKNNNKNKNKIIIRKQIKTKIKIKQK